MALIVFAYGLIIGSFLNVVIYRIPREESIAFPGSHCTKCAHPLKWYDNIPLLSYILLKGKCRYCKAKISLRYPAIELLNAIIYLIFYLRLGVSLELLFYSMLASLLLSIAIIDTQLQLIPDSLVLSCFLLFIIYKLINLIFFGVTFGIINSIIGAVVSGLLFLLIVLISRGGMGGGDVTLITALGFIAGWRLILLTIFLAFILGAIISLALLATKIKSRKDPIPFGPFIILGFTLAMVYGERILDWYLYKLTAITM